MIESHMHKRALTLSYLTVGYNILEGIASIIAGWFAGSIALVGFGLDSFVESLSGGVMVWRFRKHGDISEEAEDEIEQRATRLVGYTFLILGAYVLYESVHKLYLKEEPEPSVPGIVIAILSIIIMPLLYYFKNRTAQDLGSRGLAADARETLACSYLSIALLLGLLLNSLFGLWWADPVVGLIVVLYLLREGRETLAE